MAEATKENLAETGVAVGEDGAKDAKKAVEDKGHTAHTQDSDSKSLRGAMRRPIKVTMMGAGSGFTPRVVCDILQIAESKGGEIALVDIDENRLSTMHRLIGRQIAQMGLSDEWKVVASSNRRDVLKGTDYIINCIEVSGTSCVRFDNDIPAKYGIDQCIGDTIGPGGLFKALRTIPVWLDVLRDAEELCPQALVLNYTNPMNMLCLAAGRTSSMSVVGLCHSVQGTSHLMAERAGIPYGEMVWECAGINHLAWFTTLQHNGVDLYPLLKDKARADLAQAFAEGRPPVSENGDKTPEHKLADYHNDMVRKDMMLHFGAFITESSGHLSEYLPYYRKRKDLVQKYSREGYDGGSSFYANNWPTWRQNADKQRNEMVAGEREIKFDRSWEYASWIIEAREKDVPWRIHGNVMNRVEGGGALITNLPEDGCVEVACMIDQNGVQPTRYGKLPPQMAALCDSNMRMFDLGAQAAIERSKELAVYALMLDPLTSAVCSTDEIRRMTYELFDAEAEFLPDYK